MAFDLATLKAAVATHGRVARIVIAEVAGSSPREVGASMLVWEGGQSGTIGGGALEYQAAEHAFAREGVTKHPLGPDLGQCCGGVVTLLTEQFDAASVAALEGRAVYARGPGEMPLAVQRMLTCARNQGVELRPRMVQGWFVEPMATQTRPVWIWGAGHVGRALVNVLLPLPEMDITWVDTAPARFPETPRDGVNVLPASDPLRVIPHAPDDAMHIIVTYSHALDLALCDALLRHGFSFAGLIGSDTKKARFASRLRQMGHTDAQIARIHCPIGQKSLGKHPQAIAVGVASQLLDLPMTKAGAPWQTRSSAFRA
ncbi:xanthine dehydrogenase accessory protein XdhC [Marivita sp. S6314]|uniref:xanthine dehydrogenase accessory protein XdhC n=1 Tax=Marivita sp. S6314 TaxID=2926406 RepID=UPI001FF3D5E9|nr:xanthine dehydrogenase accessory protein XdhC [Marivita sp. S6314]MCK0149704.1 xanthine dehydrogenase accessory protein XdhC [Marivita sp. S6314]